MSQLNSPQQPAAGGAKLVIIALGLALLAVVLNSLYIAAIQRRATEETFGVFVLTRSMSPGDRIKKQDVKKVSLPRRFEAALKDLGAIDEPDLETRLDTDAIQRPASAGDILRYAHFDPPEGKNIDTKIPTGRRLVALPVNSRTLPGALREGMFVDIEGAFQVGAGLPQVMTIMEDAKVVAVGTRTVYDESDTGAYRAPTSYHAITILVKPADATHLAMIERLVVGDFEIQLRNPGDKTLAKISPNDQAADSEINPKVLDLIDKRMGEPAAAKR